MVGTCRSRMFQLYFYQQEHGQNTGIYWDIINRTRDMDDMGMSNRTNHVACPSILILQAGIRGMDPF